MGEIYGTKKIVGWTKVTLLFFFRHLKYCKFLKGKCFQLAYFRNAFKSSII